MPAVLSAAARTPWAPRHGALASLRPEELLAAAINGAVLQRGLDPAQIGLLLVACDTTIGALDLNLARRVALSLGWPHLPAMTVDGQRTGDLGLVSLAATRPGITVVAALDLPSVVPPGAGMVRDYGRPTLAEPEYLELERMAEASGLSRTALDAVTSQLMECIGDRTSSAGIVPVECPGRALRADVGVAPDAEPDELLALGGEGGLLTAFHEATLADGAAALIVEHTDRVGLHGRIVQSHALHAEASDAVWATMRSWVGRDVALLADGSTVSHALTGAGGHRAVGSVLALGSAPSADGLRMATDAFHRVNEAFTVIRRGRHGQLARLTVAARSADHQP